MIQAEPELLRRALIYTGVSQPRVGTPFNGGEMFPIANDPKGLQGLDYNLAIVDEIGFQPVESWDSLRMASGKRSRSLAIGLGTPGFDRTNALYQLRQAVHEQGNIPGLVFHEYGAPDGTAVDDRAAWRKANPAIRAGFLRESALSRDLAITPEGHFRIFRMGQWYDGVDSWLGSSGRAKWDALTNPWDLLADARTWVGVDVGLKRDSTAVVVAQYRPDEPGKPAKRIHLQCKLWVPTAEEPVDVTAVMQYLRDLSDEYKVEAISYDPRFFDVPAKFLFDEGLPMEEIPQSLERMTMAVGDLYAAIMGGTLTHDVDEPFTSQVMNAQPRFNERGFTLAKGKSRGRIDAAVAAALAVDRALRAEHGDSTYETRGVLEYG
jgi:phage terminase large subunit-like protein